MAESHTHKSIVTRVASRLTTPGDVLLAMRIGVWALVLPVAKHVVQAASLVRWMHRTPTSGDRDRAREDQIATFARWATRVVRMRADGNCLERSLILYRFLGAAGADPTLVFGVGRRDAAVIGHAWVLVDGQVVAENPAGLDDYVPAVRFAADGTMHAAPGEADAQGASPAEGRETR